MVSGRWRMGLATCPRQVASHLRDARPSITDACVLTGDSPPLATHTGRLGFVSTNRPHGGIALRGGVIELACWVVIEYRATDAFSLLVKQLPSVAEASSPPRRARWLQGRHGCHTRLHAKDNRRRTSPLWLGQNSRGTRNSRVSVTGFCVS